MLLKSNEINFSQKKAKTAGDDEEEEEEEEEEDDMSSYNSDDNDERVEFEEFKPNECDPAVWEGVLEIRERRLDLEEVLAEVQKSVEVRSCINSLINLKFSC